MRFFKIVPILLVLILMMQVMPVFAFQDLSEDHWAYTFVNELADKGLVDVTREMFEPDRPVNRAELVKMVIVLRGGINLDLIPDTPTFQDVHEDDWFYPYVENAVALDIVQGYGDVYGNSTGLFGPADDVSRAAVAKVLVLGLSLNPYEDPVAPFNDVLPGMWFYGYVSTVYNWSLVDGYRDSGGNLTGIFGFADPVTRAQIAKMIYNGLSPVDRQVAQIESIVPAEQVFSINPNVSTIFLVQLQSGLIEHHMVTLLSADAQAKTATLRFRSDSVEVTLSEGDSKDVDLDGDGVSDVDVDLEKVGDNTADVKVRRKYRGAEFYEAMLNRIEDEGDECGKLFWMRDMWGRAQKFLFEYYGDTRIDSVTTYDTNGDIAYSLEYTTKGSHSRQQHITIYHEDGSITEYLDTNEDIYQDQVTEIDANGNVTTYNTKVYAYIDIDTGELTVSEDYFDLGEPGTTYYGDDGTVLDFPEGTEFPRTRKSYDVDGNLRQEEAFDENNQFYNRAFDAEGNLISKDDFFGWHPEWDNQQRYEKTGVEIVFADLVDRFDPDGDGQIDDGAVFDFRVICKTDTFDRVVFTGLGEFTAVGDVFIGKPPGALSEDIVVYGESKDVYSGLLWKPPQIYNSGEVEGYTFAVSGNPGFSGTMLLESVFNAQPLSEGFDMPVSTGFVLTPFSIIGPIDGINFLFGEDGTAYKSVRLYWKK